MEKKDAILKRAIALYFMLALFGSAIVFKTVQIMFFEGDKWRSMAEDLTVKYHTIEAVRGNIYAVDGSLLATSIPIYEVRFDPNADPITDEVFASNIDSLAWNLSKLFKDKTASEYKRELSSARNSGARYHLIKRKVRYNELKKLREFPIFRNGRYRGGLIYIQQNKRELPFRVLAARTIGYSMEGVSPVGLEGAFNAELQGIGGRRLMKKIAGGVWMPVSDENQVEPEDGADLISTIDINIQDVAENALMKQLQKHDAAYGCVVLMEVATGEIRAIANLQRGKDGNYYESYNFAIGSSTEPGSTFKLASYMAALEDGFIDLDHQIETGKGKMNFYGHTMADSKEDGYGTITVKEAFALSSNIAIAKIIDQYYSSNPQAFIDKLYAMRLNQELGIEIAGEGKPYIKSAKDESWSGISLPWISHGYEIQLTPLQILTFYNAVANNGKMVKPLFVRSIQKYGRTIKAFEPEVLQSKIASKETIEKAKLMLEEVVRSGTAMNLRDAHFDIAGKTGTAQIAAGRLGYNKTNYQASFCGYFPAKNPKYSCIVVVTAPSRNVYYGNLVAGPIFKEIANKVYSTNIKFHDELIQLANHEALPTPVSKNGFVPDLNHIFNWIGIPFKAEEGQNWVFTHTHADSVNTSSMQLSEYLVPNVKGMDVSNAVYLLENRGLRVQIVGRGYVRHQSITPGNRVQKGQTIILELA